MRGGRGEEGRGGGRRYDAVGSIFRVVRLKRRKWFEGKRRERSGEILNLRWIGEEFAVHELLAQGELKLGDVESDSCDFGILKLGDVDSVLPSK